MGGEGEGSGVKGGGKWGERGREVGLGTPPVHPLNLGRLSWWLCPNCLPDVL